MDFARQAVSVQPGCFQFLSKKARGDKEIALSAVSAEGGQLEFVSAALQGDADVVAAAVSQNAAAAKFASCPVPSLLASVPSASSAGVEASSAALQSVSSGVRNQSTAAEVGSTSPGEGGMVIGYRACSPFQTQRLTGAAAVGLRTPKAEMARRRLPGLAGFPRGSQTVDPNAARHISLVAEARRCLSSR
eukprot:TRINITY_DN56880_c0_g1_i1.p1 TRINITY_DN56880_c0_g1~~TRINITY_DN56880_c0_g1_i1.p1  ORF type:complete len:190 (-),score=42.38 TRINITY_DN56880_c0_g1_i1:795-1364(-)